MNWPFLLCAPILCFLQSCSRRPHGGAVQRPNGLGSIWGRGRGGASGPQMAEKANAVDGGWTQPSEAEDDSDGISSLGFSIGNMETLAWVGWGPSTCRF